MKLKTFLLEEETEHGSGGGGGEVKNFQKLYADTPNEEIEEEVEEEVLTEEKETAKEVVSNTPAITEEALTKAFIAARKAEQESAASTTVEEKKMTPEEFKKFVDYPQMTREQAREAFGADLSDEEADAKAAWYQKNVIDPMARHQAKLLGLVTKASVDPLQKRFTDQDTAARAEQFTQVVEKFTENIVTTQPSLKGREKLVKTAISNLMNAGYRGNKENPKEEQTKVLEEVTRLGKLVDENFSLKVAKGSSRTGTPAMAGAVNGSGAGGGSSGSKQALKPWQKLYAKP